MAFASENGYPFSDSFRIPNPNPNR
ncbi:uncharacterized protein G2W53_029737 [Senna tora]|uniref:Uncharacterized protein n=1 Tax=Senna tora TaxID=362788 RepID=A0A834T3U0_9FABA|nr:uncharacterized protein G2W53_029737 [Senna tora]